MLNEVAELQITTFTGSCEGIRANGGEEKKVLEPLQRQRRRKMSASARNNKQDGDNLAALSHLLAFTNEQDRVCREEFVFS